MHTLFGVACDRCGHDDGGIDNCHCGRAFCPRCLHKHQNSCAAHRRIEPTMAIKSRDYQRDAYRAIRDNLEAHNSTLVVMATGTGKTVVLSMVIKAWQQGRVLFVAHREELIRQAARTITNCCECPVDIEMADLRATRSEVGKSRVVVASVQTLSKQKRLEGFNPGEFGLVVIDEAHHSTARSYKKIVEYFSGSKVLGVTATPDRADEEALGQVFEIVSYEYGINRAVEDGWLVYPKQRFVWVESVDFSTCKSRGGDFVEQDLAAQMESQKALYGVVQPTLEIAGDRPTIVFAASVRHAMAMAEMFNEREPGSAACIHGETNREVRAADIRRFNRGELKRLTNCGVFLEGFDSPSIAVVAVARPTKSRSLYAQMVGRGTRPLPGLVDGLEDARGRVTAIAGSGKPFLEVIDFVGNSGKHKLVSTADILGGQYSDEVVEAVKAEAISSAKRGGTSDEVDILAALERAKHADARARAVRSRVSVQVSYGSRIVDPFDLFDLPAVREPGWHKGRKPTAKQIETLQKNGVRTDDLSFTQASQLIEEVFRRQKDGLATFKQVRLLKQHGVDAGTLSFSNASKLLSGLAASGWRKIPRQLLESVTPASGG